MSQMVNELSSVITNRHFISDNNNCNMHREAKKIAQHIHMKSNSKTALPQKM